MREATVIEYAVLEAGEIVNVVTCDRAVRDPQRLADRMVGDLTVVPLDSLPLAVKQRYRYWDERP